MCDQVMPRNSLDEHSAIGGSPLEWCGQLHAWQLCAFLLSEDEGCFWAALFHDSTSFGLHL